MKKLIIALSLLLGFIIIGSATNLGRNAAPVQDTAVSSPQISRPNIDLQAGSNETYVPKEEKECNPNYSGCLLRDASDYDCAGGSGNGPYFTGRVEVIGYDQYDLDRDGNGVACE